LNIVPKYGILLHGSLQHTNQLVKGVPVLKCDICGKTPMFGENVSHSKHHTNRRFNPNIHPATIMVDGKPKQLNLCTRCLRTQNKVKS
jgi:large subunit ribosomal protein L28